MTKAQTIEEAQPLCDSSFTAPSDPTKFYTAWNSMKLLVDKDLVYEKGRPLRKYYLSDEGFEVAKRIKKAAGAGAENDTRDKPVEPTKLVNAGMFIDLRDEAEEEDNLVRATTRRFPLSPRMDKINLSNEGSSAGQRLGGKPSDKFGVLEAKERKNRRSQTDTYGFLELLSSSPPRSARFNKVNSVDRRDNLNNHHDFHQFQSNSSLDETGSKTVSATQNDLPTFQPIQLKPGTFTVELVLDNREIRAKTDRDYIQDELRKKGVNPIVRSLELGDALWVAKCTDPATLSRHGEEGDEVVLDWIVERKRLDDLVGSIKDGRFHEQKVGLT